MALLTALIISSSVETIIEVAKANPYVFCFPDYPPTQPTIMISSPENNKAYPTNDVMLDFVINGYGWDEYPGMGIEITYDLDGQKYEKFSGNPSDLGAFSYGFRYLYNLNNLTDGRHRVQVTVCISASYWAPPGVFTNQDITKSSSIIYFIVDAKPPTVTMLSMSNATSYGADVEVKYSVNKDVSWLGYSLNGQDFIELSKEDMVEYSVGPFALWRGNFTLSELPAGDYSLIVYAKDLADNMGASEAFQFTVGQETQPETEQPFPTALIAYASVSVATVGAAILIYFKKRRK